jgi:hypothetical protein
MKTAMVTTFEVSKVVRATSPLPEVPYKQAVEALLTPGLPEHERRRIEGIAKWGYAVPLPEAPPRPVEACARYHGRLMGRVAYHPFVAAVHRAFMDHRPLCLSPDAIWLLICQGVANHINTNAERLRSRFVRHEGRVQIDVRRDDFVKGSPENPWPEVFSEFSTKVRDHVGPTLGLFLPAFSTTGPVERAAAEIVLLDAMRSYFRYAFRSRCGIPAVTLEGTTEDWEALAERAGAFADYGLEAWIEVLRPILRQFVRASQGDVARTFWRSLYKLNDRSGGPVITGWITAFFPYLKDNRTGGASVPSGVLFRDDQEELKRMLYPSGRADWDTPGFSADSLPSGLSKAPFRWHYLEKTFDMEFLGGLMGVAQDSETLTLRPEIGWAVREASTNR